MIDTILDVLQDAGVLRVIEWFMRDVVSAGTCLGAWAVMSLAWWISWIKLLQLQARR